MVIRMRHILFLFLGFLGLKETWGATCKSGWSQSFQLGCLLQNSNAQTYDNAEFSCYHSWSQSLLVKLKSPAATIGLNSFLQGQKSGTRWFIGLYRLGGKWRWSDYSFLNSTYSNWKPNQPISGNSVACATVDKTGGWYVQSCSTLLPFICQGPANGPIQTTPFTPTSDPLVPILQNAKSLAQNILTGNNKGIGYSWLTNFTDKFGSRIVGSQSLNDSIEYLVDSVIKQGFHGIHTSDVPNIPHWVRGVEQVEMLSPLSKKMQVLGIGRTPPTPKGGLTAQAVVVSNFNQLNALGTNGVKGKIVVYNEPWTTYGQGIAYRYGADAAQKLGAVAILVRSVTPFSVYSPHTGAGSRTSKIPMVCITVEDAELLARIQKRGETIQIKMLVTSQTKGMTGSKDVAFELTGTSLPNEIVLLSGHIDSWDVGEGAMDDAGGCAVMWQVLTAMKNMNMKSKRTIRVVFWGAEEIARAGGDYYNNTLKQKFVFVSESDTGVWKPTSRNATLYVSNANSTVSGLSVPTILQRVRTILEPMSVSFGMILSSGPDGDVAPWEESPRKTPGLVYVSRDSYEKYFTFHHTNGDMANLYKSTDLDGTAAMYGAIAYVYANL